MNSLIQALREAAAEALPENAFLKRDRGEALFVTDAPRRCPGADWPELMSAAGFECGLENGLLRLTPDGRWLTRLEGACPDPPDALCAGLLRFRGLAPEAESLGLFALGARCLDGERDADRFDRLLRQRAATCLRLNGTHPHDPPYGGGLYACALLRHEIETFTPHS